MLAGEFPRNKQTIARSPMPEDKNPADYRVLN